MKGCENLSKLSRMEKQYQDLVAKQNENMERMRKEKKLAQQKLEAERISFLIRAIKQTNFPTENSAVLIGAILAAKETLDGPQRVETVNHYIELYTDFAKRNHFDLDPDGSPDESDGDTSHDGKQSA